MCDLRFSNFAVVSSCGLRFFLNLQEWVEAVSLLPTWAGVGLRIEDNCHDIIYGHKAVRPVLTLRNRSRQTINCFLLRYRGTGPNFCFK